MPQNPKEYQVAVNKHFTWAHMCFALFCSAALWQSGCTAPLAPQDYRGEVIFRAQGIVHSESSREDWHQLKPALAYMTESQLQLDDSMTVRATDDSGISGNFQLELFDAPKDEVMIEFEEHPDWGHLAIAMIVAVPEEHPERVDRLRTDSWTGVCSDGQDCLCDAAKFQRELDYTYGTEHPAHYHEVLCCAYFDSADDACELVSMEGDAWIKDKPALPVDAVVQDVFLFYTDQDAPAGSQMAKYLFHSDALGLPAGYHLVQVAPNSKVDALGPQYDYSVVEPDDVELMFKRGVRPWGLNL